MRYCSWCGHRPATKTISVRAAAELRIDKRERVCSECDAELRDEAIKSRAS